MQENKSLFQNKLFQATLFVSMILVSSAIFMSQSDNIFGKAATGTITGTIVLHDSDTPIQMFTLTLPSSSCTTKIAACGDVAPTTLMYFSDTQTFYTASASYGGVTCGNYNLNYDSSCTSYRCHSGDICVNEAFASDCIYGGGDKIGWGKCVTSGGSNTQSYGLTTGSVGCAYNNTVYTTDGSLLFDKGVKYISASYSCTP